ncbi:XRE family transcriptional regulator [Acinetobacter baumannii]|jgi:transcriptional regulator with XRE-family HTH domain|uniref:XRE family transcriptional regulator n=1 Tax=Acinetobacter nosocomialis TaxID=106654 RepID=UPI001A9BD34B|nr:LexA family transcriptional regulator [Acinetobacter nosocomialis]MDC5109074.1 LexA family transcriptional regulator [Acinetobacter baumannii]MBO1280757.1 LexA family transcriptional regulator [Acinetobacter nosocomialis]HCJ0350763.1 LexA family transcriptional regulator [Acinetobacter baumannii]HCV3155765.1 LexA family transcriptional regulator [Acinetobacter baumannii]HCV3310009.1 LexA family transcriptional regulator [Acinetobacter baumannii]
MEFFAERLKYFRSQANLNQRELAEMVGISQKQISDYEVGLSQPRRNTFEKLLNALNVDEEAFLSKNIFQEDGLIILPIKNIMPKEFIYLNRSILKNAHSTEDDLEAIIFHSNIHSPFINDGDVIVVDKAKKEIEDGAFYIIEINQTLFIRRIQLKLAGYITLSAVDSVIEKETYDYGSVPIYGKVIYRQGLL